MIKNVNDLNNAKNNEITFFHSKNYEKYAKNNAILFNYFPKNVKSLLLNVFLAIFFEVCLYVILS